MVLLHNFSEADICCMKKKTDFDFITFFYMYGT